METMNLYFDMEFTSLSPDAQIISLGIVSDEIIEHSLQGVKRMAISDHNKIYGGHVDDGSKSFYAEFTNFDINRCDDWVKENVVGKLKYGVTNFHSSHYIPEFLGKIVSHINLKKGEDICVIQNPQTDESDLRVIYDGNLESFGNTKGVIYALKSWLKQFSNYHIQFICDCGTFDWYHLLQLLATWEYNHICPHNSTCDGCTLDNTPICYLPNSGYFTGLPKLPSNISPVPQDLNDLIAFNFRCSIHQAFNMNRETLAGGDKIILSVTNKFAETLDDLSHHESKHNSLWDAKVIKMIYEKMILTL